MRECRYQTYVMRDHHTRGYLPRRAIFGFFFAVFLTAALFAPFFTGFAFDFFAVRCSMMSTVGRSGFLRGLARRLASCSAIALPRSAGDFTVRAPAFSSARNLSTAVPLPPAMTAPA